MRVWLQIKQNAAIAANVFVGDILKHGEKHQNAVPRVNARMHLHKKGCLKLLQL